MTLRQNIRKVLKENNQNEFLEKLQKLRDKIGMVNMISVVGGLGKYIELLYGGDYDDFFEKEIQDKFDEYLLFLVNYHQGDDDEEIGTGHPCVYSDVDEFIEEIKFSMSGRMFYDYLGDVRDDSKEWSMMMMIMIQHINENWRKKLSEYYNLMCGD